MNPLPEAAHWRELDDALRELLDMESAHREAWFAHHCADRPGLATELRSLLASSEQDGALEHIGESALLAEALDALPGNDAPIGDWVLVRRIGSGGMAEVFLAERDHDGVRQRAALKRMTAGTDSPEQRARFLRERRILASLSDARIARYLDGGIADDGRPWLAMEHVDGSPIDRHCTDRTLSLSARVGLFREVCGAVAHAHRHLVVHRDIKPSNVLVTDDGQVKLLDFGIAKPLEADDDALLTAAPMLTPRYASPEQLRGEPASTLTDVFLLGLLLYELIVGERPFAAQEGDRLSLERALCERDPSRPSEALRRRLGAAGTPAIAPRAVRGDLDRIVLLALRKEPEQRYPSVEAFERDLGAWLAGAPVAARGDAVGYRLRKFVARHRLASAAVAGAVAISIGYTAVLLEQNATIRAQRDLAQNEAAKSAAIKDFMIDLFKQADPAHTEGEKLGIGKVLEAGSARIEAAFGEHPRVRADMLHTLGQLHHALGGLTQARGFVAQAVALRRDPARDDIDLSASLTELAAIERDDSQLDRAIDLAREAVQVAGNHAASRAASLHGLGLALSMRNEGDYTEAAATLDRAVDVYRSASPRDELALAQVRADRAGLYLHLGRLDEALVELDDALAVMAPRLGDRNPDVTSVLYNLARLHEQRGDFEAAEALFQRVTAAETQVFGTDSVDVAIDRTRLGYVQQQRGALDEASANFAAALAVMRVRLPAAHKRIAENLMGYAETLVELGRTDEADAAIDEALRILATHFEDDDWRVAEARRIRARVLHANGRSTEARALMQRIGPILLNHPGPYAERWRATLAALEPAS